MQYCWAPDDSHSPEWHGPYATCDEAHVAACDYLADCCEPGTVTRYQTAVVRRTDYYLHEYGDGVADVVVEALETLIGEEWGWEDPPIDLSDADREKLARLLVRFVRLHNKSQQFGAGLAQTHEYHRPEAP